jgi:thiol-disulfide isomerase/thioredoxin
VSDAPTTLQLPVEGELASLDGATGWINTDPLTPASLRGRPVLVEFGTFTCINWIRTLPYVRSWFEKYRNDGLVVLVVHTPEFDVERDIDRVRGAMKAMRIEFPVAVDSDYAIWDAFRNSYWPALYFAGADGRIRHHRFGEGEYDHSEIVIQQLLASAGAGEVNRGLVSVDPRGVEAQPDWDAIQSPETYVGYERVTDLASPGGPVPDRPREYALPDGLPLNRWALAGNWTVRRQAGALNSAGGRIAHRFRARDLNLVLGPDADGEPVRFRVLLDGEPPGAAHGADTDEQGTGTVTETRLYQLIRQPGRVGEHLFEITFPDPGVSAYVFTFG